VKFVAKLQTMKTYNQNNFHKYTFCLWKEVSQADFELQQPQFKSKSGSEYYFTKVGVYRISNHWGRAANCSWRLIPLANYKSQQTKIGFAKWTDFYPNDETANSFFIKVDYENKKVDYFHKELPSYDGKAILRNASETTKTIQTIKQVLNEEGWAKYLVYEDLERLRRDIVEQLVHSNLNFNEIKKTFYSI
jgi:hypothetical protein